LDIRHAWPVPGRHGSDDDVRRQRLGYFNAQQDGGERAS
jgi:hypothetical protein